MKVRRISITNPKDINIIIDALNEIFITCKTHPVLSLLTATIEALKNILYSDQNDKDTTDLLSGSKKKRIIMVIISFLEHIIYISKNYKNEDGIIDIFGNILTAFEYHKNAILRVHNPKRKFYYYVTNNNINRSVERTIVLSGKGDNITITVLQEK